jgi:hypothetical protein
MGAVAAQVMAGFPADPTSVQACSLGFSVLLTGIAGGLVGTTAQKKSID